MRHIGQYTLELAEAFGTIKQVKEQHTLPFPTDDIQSSLNGAS